MMNNEIKNAMDIFTEYLENRLADFLHDEYGFDGVSVRFTHWDDDFGEAHFWANVWGSDFDLYGDIPWIPDLPIETAGIPWCANTEPVVDFENLYEVYNTWDNSPQFLGTEDECENYVHDAEEYEIKGLAIRPA